MLRIAAAHTPQIESNCYTVDIVELVLMQGSSSMIVIDSSSDTTNLEQG
jgi:hypothetical protein